MTESIQSSKPAVTTAKIGRKKRRVSFRQQLFSTFAAFGLTVSLLAAAAYAYFTTQYLRDLYLGQASQATENFAQLSELALLYGSGENAEDAAEATLSFPSITYVAVIADDGSQLMEAGSWLGESHILAGKHPSGQSAELLGSKSQAWHFWAPVYTEVENEFDIDSSATEQEYLGYVYVVQDKAEFIQTEFEIFRKNILIGLLGGLLFVAALHLVLNRLLAPMTRLANVMEKTRLGDTTVRAQPSGPAEIIDMANVYNQVMDNLAERDERLLRHTETLESEVSMRTQELVHARDQALEASKHKSEFLANISHELRTPLQGILGYSDVLKESLEDECMDEHVEDVERIIFNGSHLLNLINSILDLSKIEAGRMELHISKGRVSDVVMRVSETLLPLMQQNNNELRIDIDTPERMIQLDDTKLMQVILNLASNAGKFTKDGSVDIRVRHTDEELFLEVEDSGIGMDEDHLKIIFDPFRQIDGSTTREFEGTGLGLSITKRFCDVLGGHISVRSQKGEGSCFTVRFQLPMGADENQTIDVTV